VADQTTFVDLPPAGLGSHLTSHKVSGGLGGGQIGYQKQFGQWVLGGEFSGAFSALEGNSKSVFQAADDIYTTKITDLFLATGRVGYAAGMWMPYIRAGFASANVKTSIVDTNPPIPSGAAGTWFARERHYGWTAGVGIEYAIAPNWIVGVQYDHVGLDSKNHSALGVTSSGVSQLWAGDIDVDRIDLVTARISYKFGAGPVVAKY
jgi:outer membrane immunogenic protein